MKRSKAHRRPAPHTAKLEDRGLRQVTVWVPEGRMEEAQAAARRLRLEDGIPLPTDRQEPEASSQ